MFILLEDRSGNDLQNDLLVIQESLEDVISFFESGNGWTLFESGSDDAKSQKAIQAKKDIDKGLAEAKVLKAKLAELDKQYHRDGDTPEWRRGLQIVKVGLVGIALIGIAVASIVMSFTTVGTGIAVAHVFGAFNTG